MRLAIVVTLSAAAMFLSMATLGAATRSWPDPCSARAVWDDVLVDRLLVIAHEARVPGMLFLFAESAAVRELRDREHFDRAYRRSMREAGDDLRRSIARYSLLLRCEASGDDGSDLFLAEEIILRGGWIIDSVDALLGGAEHHRLSPALGVQVSEYALAGAARRLDAGGNGASSVGFLRRVLVDLSERLGSSCDPFGCLASDWLVELSAGKTHALLDAGIQLGAALAVLEAAPDRAISDERTRDLLSDVARSPVLVGGMLSRAMSEQLFVSYGWRGAGEALMLAALESTEAAVRLVDRMVVGPIRD